MAGAGSGEPEQQAIQVAFERGLSVLAEQPDPSGLVENEQAHRVGEDRGGFGDGDWRHYPLGSKVELVERHDETRAITRNRQPGRCCVAGCSVPGQAVMVEMPTRTMDEGGVG
jgi:hypothetical protein